MSRPVHARMAIAVVSVVILIAGLFVAITATSAANTMKLAAYFDNTNGLFVGDEVRILGVRVGEVDRIDVEPQRVKVSFTVEGQKVPADAKAVILAPMLVTARSIQLTPAYQGGPEMADGAVIPEERTAVPVEWDDVRTQLQRLADELQPSQPGGVSTLGALINTAADNLRGQGGSIRDALIKLSQAMSALGDHSGDLFSTLRNLSVLVSALKDSSDVMRQLNVNLATITNALADDPGEISNALKSVSDVSGDVQNFVAQNREALGVTSDKLASVSQALTDSVGDIKQLLHTSPNVLQNFLNIYQPAQGTLSGALSTNNFSDPISFICGAVQAASRLGAEQSSKLCVQYLAPIIKNRQYNFFPVGLNPFVGAVARPNEVTYADPRMRPDYVPPQPNPAPMASTATPPVSSETPLPPGQGPLLPAEAQPTNPSAGIAGMMTPPGGGS